MLEELKKRVEAGLVSAISQGRLTLYNYTNHCVYERAWDVVTMAARGLVLDQAGAYVARPWPKFFNLNERPETMAAALPAETPELSQKYDGSLLVVFYDLDEHRWRAVTRGCWANPQTAYAEQWLTKNGYTLDVTKTYLFELVAPWNRIVIPYDKDEMILLGVVDTESGADLSYAQVAIHAAKKGLRPVEFETKPIAEISLQDPKVRDREGFVARFSNGLRVKLKYQQYMILHKILTGLSVKGIWELLSMGRDPSFENVPDEFMDWFKKQRDGLKSKYVQIEDEAKRIFAATPEYKSRKEYALEFTKHGLLSGVLFAMLDNRSYSETIWRQIRPEGKTDTFQNEDPT